MRTNSARYRDGVADIVVVGAGISGLTTALTLLEAGHRVRIVSAEPSAATTSAIAAAVWFPTHVGPPDLVARWGAHAYGVLAAQADRGVPGMSMLETLALSRSDPWREPPWAAAVGGVHGVGADALPAGYRHGWRFTVPLAEMPPYLAWLVERIHGLGGDFTHRRIASLHEFADACDVVVNCSGLGARELVGDQSVYPVRGQVVRVSNPGLRTSVRDEHHPGGRAYVHPRSTDCILGGTLDEHAWDTTLDEGIAAAILARCTDLVPELRDAHVLGHAVGLRPGRPTVRLEEDEPLAGGARVIHDYGHGGAGITLSWGCAADIAAIIG